ncbi:MAG: CHAT domain-containing protein, partial [Bacteroidota bacterium]
MNQPVFFLAFANDDDRHLPLLDQERKSITQHLFPLENQSFIQLVTESAATIQDISNYLSQIKDRLAIFHYAGHADSQSLVLKDQTADGEGLADMLKLQKNLKLVFLNGCSTQEQVKRLLNNGVPAVIATSVAIEDNSAKNFADTFYQNLATQHTIKEAFDMAAARHKMASSQPLEWHRSPGAAPLVSDEDILPWGLYTLDDARDVLDWKIPLRASGTFIIANAGLKYNASKGMNTKLVEVVANEIIDYSPRIRFMFDEAKRRKKEPRMRELRAAVIDAFPIPIGVHLRRLLQSDKVSVDRLSRMINLYQVSIEFLAFILLAQLWDERHKKTDITFTEAQNRVFEQILNASTRPTGSSRYVDVIRTISDIFDLNEIDHFVGEFEDLKKEYYEDSAFLSAHLALEELAEQLKGTIAADEIESFCVQAEDHLCTVFKHIGFAAKYTLATIKKIELHKRRHTKPNFVHNLVILNRLTENIGDLDDVLISDEFSDNNAVVLLNNEDEVYPYLNLSPFLIDENA